MQVPLYYYYTVKIHFVFVFSFQLINTVFVSENNNDIWFALKKTLVVVVNRHHNACMFGQFLISKLNA